MPSNWALIRRNLGNERPSDASSSCYVLGSDLRFPFPAPERPVPSRPKCEMCSQESLSLGPAPMSEGRGLVYPFLLYLRDTLVGSESRE